MQPCKNVKLRIRKLKGDKSAYYLDYWPPYRDPKTMENKRHEYLGIYIYTDPKDATEMRYNKQMAMKAEAIRCRRFDSIVNERYDFFDKEILRTDFLQYFREFLPLKDQKWKFVYKHFNDFVDGRCLCEEIDVTLCNKFRTYLLLNAKNRRTGKSLNQNSVAGYWSTFRGFLKIAYKEKRIKENVNDFLDKIEYLDSEKETLSLEEIYKLVNTPCEIEVLKKACLFSCFTGLRRSDIINLEWSNIKEYSDGGSYLEFISQKTKALTVVPINDDTIELIGNRNIGKIFKGLTITMTYNPLKDWLEKAKISKHITFHSFRHTFASLQIELGTDIYTVQRLLEHKSVSTTEIYARHADPKKREAATKLSLKMLNEKFDDNKKAAKDKKKSGKQKAAI